jgi:hypothetical protein
VSYSVDFWHKCLCAARQYLKGWNANNSREAKKEKKDILSKLEEMDRDLESQGGDRLWVERYQLEGKLQQIFQKEEVYWQQRGSERWILMGDANTKFFHTNANGRRRKKMICSMETEDGVLTEQKDISKHIVELYKILFGSPITDNVHLESGFYPMEEQLGAAKKVLLSLPFSENDVVQAINGMNSDSAPGPNGFTAMYFKKL